MSETSNLDSMARQQPGKFGRIAVVSLVMLALVGAGIAVELADVYYQSHVDPSYESFCSVSEAANCQTVAMSEYSVVLGCPVSVWAIAGYAFFAFLAVLAGVLATEAFALGFLFLFGLLFIGVSIWLVVLMAFIINSLCILCGIIDIINVCLFILVVLLIKLQGLSIKSVVVSDFTRLFSKPLWLAGIAATGIMLLTTAWFVGNSINDAALAGEASALQQAEAQFSDPATCSQNSDGGSADNSLAMGVTEDGHPWIGATNPVVEIHEFTDYECPWCQKAYRIIRQLMPKVGSKVRVYHRHFPLNSDCNPGVGGRMHPNACVMSRMAICASQQGRFWEVNDFLFEHAKKFSSGELTPGMVALQLGLEVEKFDCCMKDSNTDALITRDVNDGILKGLEGTPSFYMNGKFYSIGELVKILKKYEE